MTQIPLINESVKPAPSIVWPLSQAGDGHTLVDSIGRIVLRAKAALYNDLGDIVRRTKPLVPNPSLMPMHAVSFETSVLGLAVPVTVWVQTKPSIPGYPPYITDVFVRDVSVFRLLTIEDDELLMADYWKNVV